jgi:NADH-quinone oxidoreductase subunit C
MDPGPDKEEFRYMNEDIKSYISDILPSASFDETGEWLNIMVEPNDWKPTANMLRHSSFEFDYLFCLTCIDWKTHLTMVYHLTSTKNRQLNVVIKIKLDRDIPEIETVSGIWRTAEFHEREVYEMFGVKFLGHPDLRRLILTDDFEGYPMRKDFEDPINMIKL